MEFHFFPIPKWTFNFSLFCYFPIFVIFTEFLYNLWIDFYLFSVYYLKIFVICIIFVISICVIFIFVIIVFIFSFAHSLLSDFFRYFFVFCKIENMYTGKKESKAKQLPRFRIQNSSLAVDMWWTRPLFKWWIPSALRTVNRQIDWSDKGVSVWIISKICLSKGDM